MTRIVFFGTSKLAAVILNQLIEDADYEIVAVVTRPDKPVGRKAIVTPSHVGAVAMEAGLTVYKPTKLDSEFVDEITKVSSDIDYLVVAAYGKIIPKDVLEIAKRGAVNVHGSLLPKYRGASPIQSAILNGDQVTGVTIMLMDEAMDHGPMLAKSEILISKTETFSSLEDKMAEAGAKLLAKTLREMAEGKIQPEVQDEDEATYCKLIRKSDGYFEIDNPPSADKLDQMIRAYYPWPNAWTRWNGKIVKLYPEGKMQMEGKNIVSREEFVRGYPNWPIKQ